MIKCCLGGTCAILIALFIGSLCRAENEGGYSIADESPLKRVKRVYGVLKVGAKLSKLGNKALKKILIGATQIVDEKNYRVFEKAGDFDTALYDFRTVGAEIMAMSKVGRTGVVGNRVIQVKLSGYENYPTLYLTRRPRAPTSPQQTEVFVYKPEI